jgi:hypothetical protein
MAAAIAAITISPYLGTASEPHLLSNTSTGKAVTEDVKSIPPTRSLSHFSPSDCPRLAIASG